MALHNPNILSNTYNKYPAAATALISFLIILCATIPTYIIHGGFCIYGDHYSQYIPFFIETRHMIESGHLWWSWNSGFGNNFIGAYSYYTLYNPFSLLILLSPPQYIADAMYWVMLLKFAIGSYIAFHYIRLFVSNQLATLGSILYIFSSFTLSIIVYYNFIDAMVLFPLMLIAIERYMMKGKKDYGFIAFSFFINAIAHYYLFVSSIISVVIYCVIRLFSKEWNTERISKSLYITVMAALGTAMASYIFLPTIFSLQGGMREFYPVTSGITTIFTRLLSLFYPFDARYSTLIPWTGFLDPSCYLPVISITIALGYIIRKPRTWLSILLIILTLCISTPYLSGIFNLYSQAQYTRWAYFLALMLSLASVRYIKEWGSHTQLLKICSVCTTIVTITSFAIIMAIMYLYKNELLPTSLHEWCCRIIKDATYPTHNERGRNIIIITFLLQGLSLLYIFNNKLRIRHLFSMITLGAIIIWSNYCHLYCIKNDFPATSPCNEYVSHTFSHRYALQSHWLINGGLYYSLPTSRHYHSILNHNHKQLYQLDTKMLFSEIKNDDDAFFTLGSTKYYLNKQDTTINITPYENYIPMGYTYDSYTTLSDAETWFRKDTTHNIFHFMLATLIVQDNDTTLLPPTLARYHIPDTLPDIASLAQARSRVTCSMFEGTSQGFAAQIQLTQPDILFFSIPCDKGFTIKVNGQETTPLKVNAGFMGIMCDAGVSQIEATYRTPWLKEGIILSVIAFAITLLILLFQHLFRPTKLVR